MNTPPFPQIIAAVIRLYPSVVPHLSPEAIKAAEYDGIRTVMRGEIFGSVYGYLETGGNVSSFRERMATAVSKAYIETADLAYTDAGADLPLDEETAAWAREQLDAQLGFVDQLFEDLKQLRKDGGYDSAGFANARAEGYAGSLDSFYNEVKIRAGDNVTLEFGGDSGKESCGTCQSLMGKRHRAKYVIERGLVPHPGNENFECQCYNCQHFWFNPKTGEEFRI